MGEVGALLMGLLLLEHRRRHCWRGLPRLPDDEFTVPTISNRRRHQQRMVVRHPIRLPLGFLLLHRHHAVVRWL